MKRTVVLWAISLTLLAGPISGCRPELTSVPLPQLNSVKQQLGYALAPELMPEGFEFQSYQISGPGDTIVTIAYTQSNHTILISYTREFPDWLDNSSLSFLHNLGLDWRRPEDAVSDVTVNGKPATLIRGMWDNDTLNLIARADFEALHEHTPGWDYDTSWGLYFTYELSDSDPVDVVIMGFFEPEEWITADEMVAIAESVKQID